LIRRIRGRSDLNFAPLTVGRHKLPLGCEILELLVDTLFLNAALSLNKRRIYERRC
jgi:hypothetical protein